MLQEFEQTVHIEDPALAGMREDANAMLRSLIKRMIDKDSLEGKLSISIDVKLDKEMVKNTDPSIEGDRRPSYTPSFKHKIGSVMQLKEDVSGEMKCEDMELVWDEDMKDFVMRPATGKDQRTVFDAEFREVDPDEELDEEDLIEGPTVPLISAEEESPMPKPTEALPFEPTDDDYFYTEPDDEGGVSDR